MLEIKDLHATVGGTEILKGLHLVVEPGEVHAIMGPNGSGKSTLSYVLAGREGYDVTGGRIIYNGEDLTNLEPEERAAKGIFLAFQYPVEIPGVPNSTFLNEALNAVRRYRGEEEPKKEEQKKEEPKKEEKKAPAKPAEKKEAKPEKKAEPKPVEKKEEAAEEQKANAQPVTEPISESKFTPTDDPFNITYNYKVLVFDSSTNKAS